MIRRTMLQGLGLAGIALLPFGCAPKDKGGPEDLPEEPDKASEDDTDENALPGEEGEAAEGHADEGSEDE